MITVKFTACWTHEIVMVSTNTFSARGWDFLLKNICTLKDIYSIKVLGLRYKYQIKERGRSEAKKKQVWLISKSKLSCSYYFLQNLKIFIYDEDMARQSLGVSLIPIQNIGE